jgi:hypothetical protein
MSKSGEQNEQSNLWTWLVVSLAFGVVIFALYGPLLWGLIHTT